MIAISTTVVALRMIQNRKIQNEVTEFRYVCLLLILHQVDSLLINDRFESFSRTNRGNEKMERERNYFNEATKFYRSKYWWNRMNENDWAEKKTTTKTTTSTDRIEYEELFDLSL